MDAALFAVRSPLSRGAILADEVGLGKTIEAGLVIAQRWAERRRRILLILPATLRKQWQQELTEKFGLPAEIIEGASYNAARRAGILNPLDRAGTIILCSYQFAAAKADDVRRVPWDLVVMDEAHRLRNVYKSSSKTARAIKMATERANKLLLTATPLQNSLMELYGLVSMIDENVFGDEASFREQFVRAQGSPHDETTRDDRLRARLRPVCTRTLRKQVLEYVRFTQRIPLTQEFYPHEDEHRLYELVSAYLKRDSLAALPSGQRALMTMVLWKLLASSTFAIAGTLGKLVRRLETATELELELDDDDLEELAEIAEEWNEEAASDEGVPGVPDAAATPRAEQACLTADELGELREYAALAESISVNSKGTALLEVLGTALDRAQGIGAPRKAVIFTESRRTQSHLLDLLSRNGYDGQVVMMNGSNADPISREIHARWLERHAGTDLPSGSRTADTKAAIVEEFRDRATILIATESAAEGVNLQFCSLVINYDLPWNPQRVEQRIGRCHRYGQKHDVVVVNFLNKRNAADQRVYQLLDSKFKLFDGVFGASDEVLGALESGVDLEKRIARLYKECRTDDEIQKAFDQLQEELDEQIAARMADTRRAVLEHFDEDVQARLRVHRDQARAALDERQQWLLALTRQEVGDDGEFDPGAPRFIYRGDLARHGHYHMDWREAERLGDNFYREDHELARALIRGAVERELPTATVTLDYSGHGAQVSAVAGLVGRQGWLELSRVTMSSLQQEEFLVASGQTDDGTPLDEELCVKLMGLAGAVDGPPTHPVPEHALATLREQRIAERRREVETRNRSYFDEEIQKLDGWADDLRLGLERELKELDRQIRDARRAGLTAASLDGKLAAQKELRALEQLRKRKRRDLYDAQDEIDARREDMIGQIERQLAMSDTIQRIFTLRWMVT